MKWRGVVSTYVLFKLNRKGWLDFMLDRIRLLVISYYQLFYITNWWSFENFLGQGIIKGFWLSCGVHTDVSKCPQCYDFFSINTPVYKTSRLSSYPHIKWSTSNMDLTTPLGPLHSCCLIVHVFIQLNKCILRVLLSSLECSFKHWGLTSSGVLGQPHLLTNTSYCPEIKNIQSELFLIENMYNPFWFRNLQSDRIESIVF